MNILSGGRRPNPPQRQLKGRADDQQVYTRKVKQQAPQLILDRIPKHMDMRRGDIFFVPQPVATLRVDIEWSKLSKTPVEIEVSCLLLEEDYKRYDYITPQRKVSRDKSIAFTTDDVTQLPSSFSRRESIGVRLKAIPGNVCRLAIVVSVKTASKTLADIAGPSLGLFDVGYYPDSPELARFTFDSDERFFPSAIVAVLEAEGGAEGARNWRLQSLSLPLIARTFRQVSDDLELQLREYTSSFHPLQRSCGGDFQRVLIENLRARATGSGGGRAARTADKSQDVRTESDETDSDSDGDSLRLFYIQNGTSSYQCVESNDTVRPTIVRKARAQYTAGKGAIGLGTDSDGDSDPTVAADDMFGAAFPDFRANRVTRYTSKTYNIGTEDERLLQHYAANPEGLRAYATTQLAKPLEVAQILNSVEVVSTTLHPIKPDLPTEMRQMISMSQPGRIPSEPSAQKGVARGRPPERVQLPLLSPRK